MTSAENPFNLRTEDGWYGFFTRAQFAGAIANGSRIRKVFSPEGDTHPVGSLGTVIGSIGVKGPGVLPMVGYFIEWDAAPRFAVFVQDIKIEALQ